MRVAGPARGSRSRSRRPLAVAPAARGRGGAALRCGCPPVPPPPAAPVRSPPPSRPPRPRPAAASAAAPASRQRLAHHAWQTCVPCRIRGVPCPRPEWLARPTRVPMHARFLRCTDPHGRSSAKPCGIRAFLCRVCRQWSAQFVASRTPRTTPAILAGCSPQHPCAHSCGSSAALPRRQRSRGQPRRARCTRCVLRRAVRNHGVGGPARLAASWPRQRCARRPNTARELLSRARHTARRAGLPAASASQACVLCLRLVLRATLWREGFSELGCWPSRGQVRTGS